MRGRGRGNGSRGAAVGAAGTADAAHFAAVDAHDAEYLVRFLDARSTVSDEQRKKALIEDALELQRGMTVLDIGSGTGVDTCRVAEVVAPGDVVGLDPSARMVAVASARAREVGSAARFVQGDAMALPFPDAVFDRCRTEHVLMHLDAPVPALREMSRVTRPGGIVVVSEIDCGTMFLAGPDDVAAAIEAQLRSAFPSGCVGRQLPRLFTEAGLVDVRCVPMVLLTSVAFVRMVVGDRLDQLVTAGAVDAAVGARYWADQERGEREGWLQTGVTCFTTAGRVPQR